MTEINLDSAKSRRSLRVDLTPMVDLGFILISFFLFTTTLTSPSAMRLTMPDKPGPDSLQTAAEATLTLYPGPKSIRYIEGKPGENPMREVFLDRSPSLRDEIIHMQKRISKSGKFSKDAFMVIIKPAEDDTYGQVIGVLDEMTINAVKKYVIVD